MKVLLVSGGDIPIPPPRWGGVENLIWQQTRALKCTGHQAEIWNEKARGISKYFAVLRAKPWQYTVVHLHLDSHTKYWLPISRLLRFKLVVSTHYGYAAFPDKWIPSYRRTFRWMRRAPYLILISPEIQKTFQRLGCRAEMFVLPNGIDCSSFRFAPAPIKQAIVLGRVEKRKQQALLAQRLNKAVVECDFAGPMDPDTGFTVNNRNTHYLGEWDRAFIQEHLTDYACLVLLSDGEGHAAVVSEAMAAGLSLVLSQEASHNLDLSQPWISVVDREKDDLENIIHEAVCSNPRYRSDIRKHCEANFDWRVILPKYIAFLEKISKTTV